MIYHGKHRTEDLGEEHVSSCDICREQFSEDDPAVEFSNPDGYLIAHFQCGNNAGFKVEV